MAKAGKIAVNVAVTVSDIWQIKEYLDDAQQMIARYEQLEAQVHAALAVYEADKTFNSTALVMADKLYTGLNAFKQTDFCR